MSIFILNQATKNDYNFLNTKLIHTQKTYYSK